MIRRITIDVDVRHGSMYELKLEASVRNAPGDFVVVEDLPREPTEDQVAAAALHALDSLVVIMRDAGWLWP